MAQDKSLLALYERTKAGQYSPTIASILTEIASSGNIGLTKHELIETCALSKHSVHKALQVLRISGKIIKVRQKKGYPKWVLSELTTVYKPTIFSGVSSIFNVG